MSKFDDGKDVTGTGFRKIDIDEYSENGFQDEENDGGAIGPTGPDESEILQLLTQYPLHMTHDLFDYLISPNIFFTNFYKSTHFYAVFP